MKTIICSLVLSILLMPQEKNPIVIGHRGAAGHATENTVPSIQKALDLGADGIEIDVYKIKSGELVVFHDDNLKRMTGVDAPIESYTLQQLQALTMANNTKIPTLQEVMDVIDKKARFNIELKGANTATDTYKVMQQYIAEKGWKKSDFVISSFRWDELETMHALDKHIALAVLIGEDPLEALPEAEKLHAEAINPHFSKLTKENVALIHKKGFKIYTWTVNKPEDIEAMKTLQVDGIITNYPDRAK